MIRRRLFGVLLAAGIITSLVAASFAWADGGRFTDDDGNVHEENIELIATEAITLGCDASGTLYCPSDLVTRGQMAAFLVRALGLVNTNSGNVFTDDDGSVFEDDIEAIQAAGITLGCNSDGTQYCPTEFVTRGQMAAFISRAFGYTDSGTGDYFIDDDGSTFEDEIDMLRVAEITLGCDGTGVLYCPGDNVRRDQMASFLARALNLGGTPPPPPTSGTTAPTIPATTSTTLPDSGFNWEINTLDGEGNRFGKDNGMAVVDGLAVISTREDLSNSAALVRCANAACSSTLSVEVMEADGISDGLDGSMGIVGANPVIASHELGNQDLRVVQCTSPSCDTWTAETPVGAEVVGEYSSMVVIDGKPIIAYYATNAARTVGRLMVAACDDAGCTSLTVTEIDGTVGNSTDTAMVIVAGLPAIAYFDDASDDLEYALCLELDCSTFTHNVVDSDGQVGDAVDMAVIGGLPIMSYRDETNDTVKLARCTDTVCNSSSQQSIGGTSNVGIFTSIAEGIDGYAWVAYYSVSGGSLEFADCESATCSVVELSTIDDHANDVGRHVRIINIDDSPLVVYQDSDDNTLKTAFGS